MSGNHTNNENGSDKKSLTEKQKNLSKEMNTMMKGFQSDLKALLKGKNEELKKKIKEASDLKGHVTKQGKSNKVTINGKEYSIQETSTSENPVSNEEMARLLEDLSVQVKRLNETIEKFTSETEQSNDSGTS